VLANLISSYFIFNSMGCIDESSISQLHLVTGLANAIQDQDSKRVENNCEHFAPKFLWVLRDFTLEMKDNLGNSITPSQYLDNALFENVNRRSLLADC